MLEDQKMIDKLKAERHLRNARPGTETSVPANFDTKCLSSRFPNPPKILTNPRRSSPTALRHIDQVGMPDDVPGLTGMMITPVIGSLVVAF